MPPQTLPQTPSRKLRIICEEEPEKLSTAVLRAEEVTRPDGSTTTLTPGVVSRTRARASEPELLHRRLRGDLDNIVLKALRKEPQRRYRSAEALADEIRRHLAGQPVAACGDGVLYRCRKFVLRNRLGVAAAASLLVLLVAFGLTMARERDLSEQERQRAERERQRAERVTGFLTFEGIGQGEQIGSRGR